MINYSTSNIRLKYRNILLSKNISPNKKITRENSFNHKNIYNKGNNLSHINLKIITHDSFLNNLKQVKKRRQLNIIKSINYNNNYKNELKSSINNQNLNLKTPRFKEFNKIILTESSIHSSVKKEKRDFSNKKNNLENIKKKLYEKIFYQKTKIKDKININKKEELPNNKNKNKNIYVNVKMSIKFRKAQEKWKKDYLASVIQKVFRGYIYRKKFYEKLFIKNNLNIYIKKRIKDKNTCDKFRKIKNITLRNYKKENNHNDNYLNRTTRNYINKKDLINTSNKNNKTRDNSFKNNKIKEIIIKPKKKYPIVKLNLNNNLFINNLYDNNFPYNNYNNILFINKDNDNASKYFRRINLLIKIRKLLKYWLDFSMKKKIIIYFIETKKNHLNKDMIKDIKSDDTYNSTNSFIEEKKIIKVEKNTKLYNLATKK